MPLILYEYALHRFYHKPPIWILMINETFKFFSAPNRWLVCTTCSVINPLHLRIHSSKNYFLIFPHASTLISSITSPTTKSSDNEPVHSIDSSISAFYSDDSTYFSWILLCLSYSLCNSTIFNTTAGYKTLKRVGGRERPTSQEKARRPSPPL